MKYILVLALVSLAACSSASVKTSTINSITAAEASLTAAEKVADIYTSLPICGSAGATAVCASQSVKAQLKALDAQAYTAVLAAKNNQGTITAALTAISAFSNAANTAKAGA